MSFCVSSFLGTVVMLVFRCSLHVLLSLRGGEDSNALGKLGSQEKQHLSLWEVKRST